ncbi:hypothetical protein TNCV_331271 [Trichonephila clavipes]|nr:hypothetical protein TNCV_331271 [Trichonephila clavipes]
MARRLGNWSRFEVRAVIRFLWTKMCFMCPRLPFTVKSWKFRVQNSNYGRQRHFRLIKAQKNVVDADSDGEIEINNADPEPTSFEMRSIMKSMFSYLDEHSSGEMNNRMNDIEQFVDSLMLKTM